MKNYNKKRIITLATLFFALVSIFSINYTKDNQSNSEGIIITEDDSDGPITFNASEIKMKNIGDTFVLEATVNDDASFKKLKFTSSNPNAIKVSENRNLSCKLTKITDFTELVFINITTIDPFDDYEASVSVRSYNRISDIDNDLEWYATRDGLTKEYDNSSQVVLVENASYQFVWYIKTIFTQHKLNTNYKNTYTSIEEEDLDELITQLEDIFKNPIENIEVIEEDNEDFSVLTFEMTYVNDIFQNEDSFEAELSIYDTSTTWSISKYKAITDINIDGNNYVL